MVAKFSSPKIAGAIGGIPIVFAISYIFITLENKPASRQLLIGGIYGALAAIFFSAALLWFNAQFPKYHWINFSIAYALCFLVAFGLAVYTSK